MSDKRTLTPDGEDEDWPSPPWPAKARAQLPAGAEPLAGGWFNGEAPIALAADGTILAWAGSFHWEPAAIVVQATEDFITVMCQQCPAPRVSTRRKRPPRFRETVAIHRHGRSSDQPVQDRAGHHTHGGYVVLDPWGHLAR